MPVSPEGAAGLPVGTLGAPQWHLLDSPLEVFITRGTKEKTRGKRSPLIMVSMGHERRSPG